MGDKLKRLKEIRTKLSWQIQDIVDEDYYSDENSWEVSIVNCSNDIIGTPNSEETLGTLKKPGGEILSTI